MAPPAPRVAEPSVPHGQTAQRLTWRFLPRPLRVAVEERLGGPVVADESRESGFGTGFASVLRTSAGREVFLKAASVVAQEQVATAYRTEAQVLRALVRSRPEGSPPGGSSVPMPKPLWVSDDDSWVVIGFAAVQGRPPRRPWRPADLERALDLAEQVAATTDPRAEGLSLRRDTAAEPGLVHAWEMLPNRPHRDEALALAAAYADLPGEAFCHGQLRDDNVLLAEDGSACAVDWGQACLAPPWRDTVDLLVSAWGDGLDVEALLTGRRLTRAVDASAVDGWLAALAGWHADAALRPQPMNSPHLQTHHRWYAAAAWGWLARRRGWQPA